MQKIKETLTYKRMATKAKDGKSGPMYIHDWGTGYQELIFDNHEAATTFKNKLNTPEYEAHLKTPA